MYGVSLRSGWRFLASGPGDRLHTAHAEQDTEPCDSSAALGEVGPVDVIEAAEGLFGVSRQAHLDVGVAGGEQAAEFGVAAFGEAFVGGNE